MKSLLTKLIGALIFWFAARENAKGIEQSQASENEGRPQ